MTNRKKGYHVGTIKKKASGGLTAEVLVVTASYDDKLLRDASLYAKYPLKGTKVRTVETWEELAKLLQEYEKINRLVLYFHGIPGALLVGGVGEDLNVVGEKYFKGKKMPKVQQLDLEACSVAEGADKIVPFAKVFNASKVTAWNYFHIGANVDVNVPTGTDIKNMEASLKPYKGYYLENTPTAGELVRKPGKYVLGAEWFRGDLNEDPLPPPSGDALDPREKTFKRRSTKTEITLTSESELKAYSKKSSDPVRPLEHVTVDMSGIK